jgi:hypothetical protein
MPADGPLSIGVVVSAVPKLPQLSPPLAQMPGEGDVPVDRLADCVRRLDPGTRALLDLSVRRRFRDDAMAPLLRTDAFHLAWRRARALERVASDLGGDEPVPLAKVRSALEALPNEAWTPLALPAPKAPEPAPASGTELIPVASAELDAPQSAALTVRLDAFARSAPTLREAFGGLGRAFGRKAVRLVLWRRSAT